MLRCTHWISGDPFLPGSLQVVEKLTSSQQPIREFVQGWFCSGPGRHYAEVRYPGSWQLLSLEERVSLSLAGSFRCFVFPCTQPDVSPRVTAATGDIYRSSLSGLTKALGTWLGQQGRGRWEVPWDADSWGLVWQAFSRTGEVTGNQRGGSLVLRGKRD